MRVGGKQVVFVGGERVGQRLSHRQRHLERGDPHVEVLGAVPDDDAVQCAVLLTGQEACEHQFEQVGVVLLHEELLHVLESDAVVACEVELG